MLLFRVPRVVRCLGAAVWPCLAVACGEARPAGLTPGGAAGAKGVAERSNNAGAAGSAPVPVSFCPTETPVSLPTGSGTCDVAVRALDPEFTCGSPTCALTKALDLTCPVLPRDPWLSATGDGATLLASTPAYSTAPLAVRLMTVEATSARVDDVLALAAPSLDGSSVWSDSGVLARDSNGRTWVFSATATELIWLREVESGWQRGSVPHPPGSVTVTGAKLVDDRLGYVTYVADSGDTHLLTWEAGCWTDALLGVNGFTALAVDADGRPWLTWVGTTSASAHGINGPLALFLRSPSGAIEVLVDGTTADLSRGTPRLLPATADGAVPQPSAAVKSKDGIRWVTKSALAAPWVASVLPESAAGGTLSGDCPVEGRFIADAACEATTCTAELTGTSSAFDLVRTPSGATFAAWVSYSTEGSYIPNKWCWRGELPGCECTLLEASGNGIAELVVARLTDSAPVLSRFRFELDNALLDLSRDVVMTARGDTLLVAASLSGDRPKLTYVEIDSTLLP
jgi:hypothetical protein